MAEFKLYELLSDNLIDFLLVYLRIFFMFMTCLIFRKEYVSTRIVITITAILSLYQISLLNGQHFSDPTDTIATAVIGLQQALIGFVIGISINIMFDIFMGLGQFTSTQVGLSIANQFDPRFGMVTPLSRFYVVLAMALFFNMNGHLILIDIVTSSFNAIPVNQPINYASLYSIIKFASIIFMGTVSLGLTILIVILLTNITLAIMTKFAPQINLFSVGLSFALIIGFICIYLSYNYIITYGASRMLEVITFTKSLIHHMG